MTLDDRQDLPFDWTADSKAVIFMSDRTGPTWRESDEGKPDYAVPLMRIPMAGGPPQEVLQGTWITNHQCARGPSAVCIYSVIQDGQLPFFTFDPFKGKGAQVLQIKDELSRLYNWSLSPDGTTLAIAKGKWGTKSLAFISCASLADRIAG